MQTEPETWQIVLFLVLVAAVTLPIGGLLVIAFVDVIRQFRRRVPSRFQRVPQYDAFDHNELHAVGKKLGFKLEEEVPHAIHDAVKLALRADSIELAEVCRAELEEAAPLMQRAAPVTHNNKASRS